jgi:hypothetical protein
MNALVDGIRRVNRAPMVLVCVFAVTLLTALPFSIVLRHSLQAQMGNSLAADEALAGVNYPWWSEYAEAQPAGSLTRTFGTSVIGFAVVMDNLSTFLDRGSRPAPILMLGAAYLLLWLFLAGGILDRYARDRPTRAHEFFTACGVYFVRFLRLAPLMAAAYYILFAYVHGWLFGALFDRLTDDVTVERTALMWRMALYAVFVLLLAAVNVVFDYAKTRAVIEDRHSMIGAVAAGVRFIRRHVRAVAAVYALNALLFVCVMILYALVAPGAGGGGALMWLGVLVSQAYLLARLWVRLVFFASEASLFQSRLAHSGYVASAPVPLPEPPIVEHALRAPEPRP